MSEFFRKFEDLTANEKEESLLFCTFLVDEFNKETGSYDLANFSLWIAERKGLKLYIDLKEFEDFIFDIFNFYKISFYHLVKAIRDSR